MDYIKSLNVKCFFYNNDYIFFWKYKIDNCLVVFLIMFC